MEWTSPQYLYTKIYEFQKKYPDFFITSLSKFCKDQGWNLIPYSTYEKVAKEISEDGFCYIDGGEYNIFYNKTKPPTRQKFTICHEIGHIYLNHHKTVNPKLLKYNGRYTGIWETQANIFAHNILMPVEYMDIMKPFGVEEVSKGFGLSRSMVEVRFAKLEQDKKWLRAVENIKKAQIINAAPK